MTTIEPISLTSQAQIRLHAELGELRRLRDTVSSVSAVLDNRIRQLERVVRQLVVGEDSGDDGIAEAGMVVTVRHDRSGEVETFLLAVRDDGYGDLKMYSMFSPLGTAVFGARPGEQRTYRAGDGEVLSVTLLKAVPYGAHERSV